MCMCCLFFFKQKTAYEMRISDWSSDVCSSDLNGAERMLKNRYTGTVIGGLDLNNHHRGHVFRAAQEGIAFSFRYGMELMRQLGTDTRIIRAGNANMFLSPVFRETLSSLPVATIDIRS